MKITFTAKEIKEIIIATVVLSLAFAIADSRESILKASLLENSFVISLIAVGIGFIAHELIGHKITAQRYNYHAEFRAWKIGLVVALLFSFGGFVFAAPGAVFIAARPDLWGEAKPIPRKKYGIISLAGPAVNVIFALVFYAIGTMSPLVLWKMATSINIWLALFNMIPIPPLDGSKVFAWDRRVFLASIAVIIGIFYFTVI